MIWFLVVYCIRVEEMVIHSQGIRRSFPLNPGNGKRTPKRSKSPECLLRFFRRRRTGIWRTGKLDSIQSDCQEYQISTNVIKFQQTIVLKSGLIQDQSLAIPVDSSIKTMTIIISEKPQLAMLYGPDSIRMDLLDAASIRNFSYGSDIKVQDGKLNVRLLMNQNTVAEEQSEP